MKWKIKLNEEQNKELGKFLIDVAKLIFGGVILANILKDTTNTFVILSISILAVILLLCFGLYFIKTKK